MWKFRLDARHFLLTVPLVIPVVYSLLLAIVSRAVGIGSDTVSPVTVLASVGVIAATFFVAGYTVSFPWRNISLLQPALVGTFAVCGVLFHLGYIYSVAIADGFSTYLGPTWVLSLSAVAIAFVIVGGLCATDTPQEHRIRVPLVVFAIGLVVLCMVWLPFLRSFVTFYG